MVLFLVHLEKKNGRQESVWLHDIQFSFWVDFRFPIGVETDP